MYGIDGSKLIVIAVVALVVIGPRDIPRTLGKLGKTVGNLRRMAAQFRSQFDEIIKDTEVDEIRKELRAVQEEFKGAGSPLSSNQASATASAPGGKDSAPQS
ncbi:Sec-independent protein translocase protein TatB [Mesorhizobium sp. ANAO-SY3R2]|uniref:Sec-independent protein translocase protein TatB n=1 Tax=Mesorhizobium sp. ANAO-SY3R2 TaxID=3166644 RepID=UPI00366CF3A1